MKNAWPFVCSAVMAAVLVVPVLADTRTVKGEIVDLDCSLSNGAAGKGESHAACAMRCARDGKQMALLTADEVYLIDGDYTANKNAKLLDFVAKHVEAKGNVTEKDGQKTITIATMAITK